MTENALPTEAGKLLVVKTKRGVVQLERLPTKYVDYMVYRDGVYIGQVSKVRLWGINLRYGNWKTREEALDQVQRFPSPDNDVASESDADEHARWLGHQAFLRGAGTNPYDTVRRPKSRAAWQGAFSTAAARIAQAAADAQAAAATPAPKDNWPFPRRAAPKTEPSKP